MNKLLNRRKILPFFSFILFSMHLSVMAQPANQTCANAAPLPCGATNLAGTTVNAAQGPVDPSGCASRYGVWYQFTGDGQLSTISSTASSGWDHEMVIFSGTCGSLTNVVCRDNFASGGTESHSFPTVAGTTYYVYIAHYSASSTTTGTFTISRSCAPAPEIAQPGGANCSGAKAFCTDQSILFPNTTGVPTAQTGPAYGCVTSTKNPVWYYMEIETGGPLQLTISQENMSGAGIDVDFVMWGPFPDPSTACTSIQAGSAPIQSGYAAATVETVGIGLQGGSFLSNTGCIGVTTPPPAIAGQTYVVMITNYSDSPGYINFSQTAGTASTNCNIVQLGSILSFSGEYKNEENILSWITEHEMNVSHYKLNKSTNGTDWSTISTVFSDGFFNAGTSYQVTDKNFRNQENYYQVVSVDLNGNEQRSKIITIDNAGNGAGKTLTKITNLMGQLVDEHYEGIKIYIYSDGTTVKKG